MDSLRSPAVFGRDIVRRKRFSGATISGNSLSRHVLKTQHFSNEENLNSIRYELKQHNGSQFTTRKRPLRMGNWAFAGKLLTNPLFCQTGTLRPWSQENDFKKVYLKPFGQGFSPSSPNGQYPFIKGLAYVKWTDDKGSILGQAVHEVVQMPNWNYWGQIVDWATCLNQCGIGGGRQAGRWPGHGCWYVQDILLPVQS